jgi:glycosyltransferase involved in cell wall biosynthesis
MEAPSVNKPRNILLVSDSVSSRSGLARITRDLASRIHSNMKDEFRVATAGWNGDGLEEFPWKDFPINNVEGWLIPELPKIAKKWAGEDEIIIFFISDASRLGWFAHPDWCPIPELAEWARSPKIKKWIYAPVDAEGPNGKLSFKLDYILKGFDRVLNYSKFSVGVTGYPDYIPHGIDTEAWKPRPKKQAREIFQKVGFTTLTQESFLVGIVATNQPRKDWALGFETCKILLERGLDVHLWCHTDMIERHWDLGALVHDFGLSGRVCITTQEIPDDMMGWCYSACDVTLSIGLGEGFGFSSFESLACGIPTVYGNYAGIPEHMIEPPSYMGSVEPTSYRYEGPFCCKRPILDAHEFASTAEQWNMWETAPLVDPVGLPEHLDWKNVWPRFAEWLVK